MRILLPFLFLMIVWPFESVSQGQDKPTPKDRESQDAIGEENDATPAISEKLRAAIAIGALKIDLTPMVPSASNSGVRWSPKGNKAELKERDDWLVGQIKMGDQKPVEFGLKIDRSSPGGDAFLGIDTNGDGAFNAEETESIKALETRGKFWYSTEHTFELPVAERVTRPYPVSIWFVLDPEEKSAEPVIRWIRRGWHEGVFRFHDHDCVALITDSDSDGIFTAADAWGLGTDAKQAYEFDNSDNNIDKHAWLDSMPFQIVDCDSQSRSITIRAFDLGMSEAEDREKKDPYAADR